MSVGLSFRLRALRQECPGWQQRSPFDSSELLDCIFGNVLTSDVYQRLLEEVLCLGSLALVMI